MSATGFYHIYKNILKMDRADILCAYSFNDNLENAEWAPGSAKTAILTNQAASGDLFSIYGSGKFNGSTDVRLQGTFDEDKWTAFFVCEKSGLGNVPIFGQEVANGYSGFSVGLNSNNKLYLTYYNNVEGFISSQINTVPAQKNIMGAYKNHEEFGLYLLDPNSKQVYNQSMTIPFGSHVVSNKLLIGSTYGAQDHAASLFVDEFYMINQYVSSDIFQQLSSGFYTNYGPSGETTQTFCSPFTYISGQEGPIYSGITGYVNVSGGVIIDDCGISTPIYVNSGVSGVISGMTDVLVSGETCYTITGYNNGQGIVDTGFLQGFGKNGISQLYNIYTNDIIQSDSIYNLSASTNYNIRPIYTNLNRYFFYDFRLPTGQDVPHVYANGLYQLKSGYSTVQNGYYTDYILSGDYFTIGKKLIFGDWMGKADSITSDMFLSGRSIITESDLSGYALPGDFSGLIFANGQLLAPEIDYSSNVLSINLTDTNLLSYCPVPAPQNYVYWSGQTGAFSFDNKFLWGQGRVWLNGVRQLSRDYIEFSSVDYLSGDYLDISGSIVYDNQNSDLFFED